MSLFFFFQAEDGIRDGRVTGVQTCALPIYVRPFQVLRPRRGQRVEALVQRLEGGSLLWRHLAGGHDRSEERRVGKEGRSRGAPDHLKKKKKKEKGSGRMRSTRR